MSIENLIKDALSNIRKPATDSLSLVEQLLNQALAELERPEPGEFIEVPVLSADFEEDTITFKLPVGFWHTHKIRVGKAKISIGDAIIIAQEQSK